MSWEVLLIGIGIEIFLVYLLSRFISNAIYNLFFRLFGSQTAAIHFLAIIFSPGVLVHELAHAIVAKLLLVYVGKMEFMPKLLENSVKLGSVEIGKSDPFRRALIGLAPVLIGVALFTLIGQFTPLATSLQTNSLSFFYSWYAVGLYFFFFEVGNTMFSSKKDLEGFFELVLVIGLITGLFYAIVWFSGITLPSITIHLPSVVSQILLNLSIILGIVLVINCIVAFILKLLIRQ